MCGIASIFAYKQISPDVDREELLKLRDHMMARGPDGAGLWISANKRVGLAHRRLSIIDLSDAGSQPMSTPDGSIVVVFNGEIYNHNESRSDLEAKGYVFRSKSDTEVLLYLYCEYGRDMVNHLRGMYAFAIWDQLQCGLFLARDPFGIKPLYYADDGKTIRMASQVKALLTSNKIDKTPDPAGHAGFYLWGHLPEPYTLYKNIRALPAGTSLWIDADGKRIEKKFFSISETFKDAEQAPPVITKNEAQERLRDALLDSVRHHLIADVPVGVFLSAGLDSTTLVALASELGGELRTITLGFREFKGTENDETILAEQVAKHYGALHRTIWVSRKDFEEERENLMAAMDQPSIDGVNTYFVAKAAAEIGFKVALSGLGGDELFGGYTSFAQIPRLVKAIAPFGSIPTLGVGVRKITSLFLHRFTSPKYAGLLEYGGRYSGAYMLRHGLYMPWELPQIMDAGMAQEGLNNLQTISRLGETMGDVSTDHFKVSALETSWYMRNQLLRDSDWAGMAHSLEIRLPLVDTALLKEVAPLIAGKYSISKHEMARVPEKALPDNVLNRSKTGFSVPVREWLHQSSDVLKAQMGRGLRSWAKWIMAEHQIGANQR